MIVVPGPASQSLGNKIAESLNARIVSVNLKLFLTESIVSVSRVM